MTKITQVCFKYRNLNAPADEIEKKSFELKLFKVIKGALDFSAIINLIMPNNKISGMVDLSVFVNLTHVNLANNFISEINFTGLHQLLTVVLNKNQLSTLSLNDSPKLSYLYANHNCIDKLELEKAKSLQELAAAFNKINKFEFDGFAKLSKINLSHNLLTHVRINRMKKILEINVSSNNITSLVILNCGALHYINASFNDIAHMSLHACSNLVHLLLAYNKLRFLNLSMFKKLQTVVVKNNILEDLVIAELVNYLDFTQNNLAFLTKKSLVRKFLLNGNSIVNVAGCTEQMLHHDIDFITSPVQINDLQINNFMLENYSNKIVDDVSTIIKNVDKHELVKYKGCLLQCSIGDIYFDRNIVENIISFLVSVDKYSIMLERQMLLIRSLFISEGEQLTVNNFWDHTYKNKIGIIKRSSLDFNQTSISNAEQLNRANTLVAASWQYTINSLRLYDQYMQRCKLQHLADTNQAMLVPYQHKCTLSIL